MTDGDSHKVSQSVPLMIGWPQQKTKRQKYILHARYICMCVYVRCTCMRMRACLLNCVCGFSVVRLVCKLFLSYDVDKWLCCNKRWHSTIHRLIYMHTLSPNLLAETHAGDGDLFSPAKTCSDLPCAGHYIYMCIYIFIYLLWFLTNADKDSNIYIVVFCWFAHNIRRTVQLIY